MTSLIDWHSHHTAPEVAALCESFGLGAPAVDPEDSTDFAARRAALDANGIELQLVSQTARTGTDGLSHEQVMTLVRASNDAVADRVAIAPDRFTGTIAFSFLDVPGSVAEIDRMAALGSRAVLMYPQVQGEFLADRPESAPIFDTIARLKLPIFMHGGGNRGADPTMAHLEAGGAGVASSLYADASVTECCLRLIAAGLFDRHPELRIVIRSGGGGLPLLLKKMSWRHNGPAETRPYSEIFREHFLVDCASVTPKTLQFFIDTLGDRCVVFGSDYCGGLGPLERGTRVIEQHPDSDYVRQVTDRNSRELLGI